MAAAGPDYRAVFQTLTVPYAILDRGYRYVALNRMVEEITGLSQSEMIGTSIFAIFPEEDERQRMIQTAFDAAFLGKATSMTEVAYAIPIPGRPNQRREQWWTLHFHPIPSPGGITDFIGFQAENITADKRARELKDAVAAELQHRVKNTLSLVQIIARQTARNYGDADAFIETFDDRIVSLAKTHALLTGTNWDGLTFGALASAQLSPDGSVPSSRLSLNGPSLLLSSMEAQALSMALHELTTNAIKHGALSGRGGTINVEWRLLEGDGYAVTWSETGMEPVDIPSNEGFGVTILNRILPAQLGGKANQTFTADCHTYRIVVEKRRG